MFGVLVAFVKISFNTNFAYRSSVFMGLIGSLFSIVIQITVWSFIFRKDVTMIQYMTTYVILSRLLGLVYFDRIGNSVGEKIISGDFVLDLIKPVNSVLTYWSISLGGTLSNIVLRGLPLLVVFSPVLLGAHLSLGKGLGFVGLSLVGYVLLSLIYILNAYLGFVVTEIWPFTRMLGDSIYFLSGAVVPLAFFPDWLVVWMRLLPFHLVYSFPIRFLLEDLPLSEVIANLLLLSAWIVFLTILVRTLYQKALWHTVVQGG